MKATTVVVLLILASASLGSQSVSFNGQLRPFHINRLIVTDLQSGQDPRVEIAGLTVDGRQVQLFSTATEALPGRLECFIYFDDSVQTVRIQISFSIRETVLFEYPTELNPYQVTVFASPQPPLRGYRFTSSIQLLGPGDILVLDDAQRLEVREEEIQEFLDRGIHVITVKPLPRADTPPAGQHSWRGILILLDSLDKFVLAETLATRRESFATFKKRFYDLTAGSGFFGISPRNVETLIFAGVRLEDIAAAVEQRYPPPRLTGSHKLLLLGFSVAAIILVVFIRRTSTLVLCLAVVLSLFSFLSLLNPDPDQSLHISFNLNHSSSEKIELVRTNLVEKEQKPLSSLFAPEAGVQRFVPTDYDQGAWSLEYGLIRSANGEVALDAFTETSSVKFDQLPKIEYRRDGYTLKYINPLRYWSLHEPD